jgi:DNA helicase-2/ATP-dependent DNA helicase PcrA
LQPRPARAIIPILAPKNIPYPAIIPEEVVPLSSVRHRDFDEESHKLREAVAHVSREQVAVEELEKKQLQEVIRLRLVQREYYHEWFVAEKVYAITSQKLKNLRYAEKTPYFARVDFRKDGEPETERLYIGKWGVTDARTRKPYVYDWRSPIANLYYGAQVGPAEFQSPGGTVSGDMSLKRIFTIYDGQLHSIIDADIATQDEYLHEVLSDHANARLRDIVTTIQKEQNDIIRHNYKRPMVVQGVAGAGKTTVALHRITWLLYTYQQTMMPENLMVIAPSPLFLNYISAVLPELGAENVLQTTFYGLGALLTGKALPKLDDSGTLLKLLDMPEEARAPVVRVARLKGSLLFKECLRRHIDRLAAEIPPAEGLRLGPAVICTREELVRLVTKDLSPFPLVRRLPQLKKILKTRVADALAAAKRELESETARRANLVREKMPLDTSERRGVMQRLYAARNARLAEFDEYAARAADDCMAGMPAIELMREYRNFLSPEPAFDLPEGVDPADWRTSRRSSA